MRAYPIALVVLAIFVFLVAGCAPVSPSPSAEARQEATAAPPSPSAEPAQVATTAPTVTAIDPSAPLSEDYVISNDGSISFTEGQRQAACELDPAPNFDSSDFLIYGLPILWTFQVNFGLSSDGSGSGRPVACLHLYIEDGVGYKAMDDGGILIDSCIITTNSGNPVGAGVFDPVVGIITMQNDEYVSCDMDLAGWTATLATRAPFSSPDTAFMLNQFGSLPQDYPRFTMVALATPANHTSEEGLPLGYYLPGASAPSPRDEPIVFSLKNLGSDVVTFPVNGCPSTTSPTCPQYNFDETHAWWYDFQITNTVGITNPTLVYAATDNLAQLGRNAPDTDSVEAPVPFTLDPTSPRLQFWGEEATFYIGYNPDTKVGFTGVIDSILIDPVDSKATNDHG